MKTFENFGIKPFAEVYENWENREGKFSCFYDIQIASLIKDGVLLEMWLQ